jgi:hypothetical protein
VLDELKARFDAHAANAKKRGFVYFRSLLDLHRNMSIRLQFTDGKGNPHFSSPHHPDWQMCAETSGLQGATDGRQIDTLCSGAEAPRGLKPTLHCVSTIDRQDDEKCRVSSMSVRSA